MIIGLKYLLSLPNIREIKLPVRYSRELLPFAVCRLYDIVDRFVFGVTQ